MRLPLGRTGTPRRWASRASVLPAIGVAALPKCPLCVMALFGALGIAHPLHDTVFAMLQAAALLAVVCLFAARRRGASPARLVAGAGGACCIVLGAAGLAAPALGYAGAVLLAGAWIAKPRGTPASACGCAADASAASG